ncbi:MAG: DoxX family membrane protein [bacterium]|nr:DoxX family membrane protein [bacterium]
MNSFLWGKRASWPLQIAVWLLAFYVAWNMIPAGWPKLMAYNSDVNMFEGFGLPQWLVVVVGAVEVFAPLLLFIPQVSFYGALPLVIVMAAATYYSGGHHMAITLGVLSLIIAIVIRPGWLKKKPIVTTIHI